MFLTAKCNNLLENGCKLAVKEVVLSLDARDECRVIFNVEWMNVSSFEYVHYVQY